MRAPARILVLSVALAVLIFQPAWAAQSQTTKQVGPPWGYSSSSRMGLCNAPDACSNTVDLESSKFSGSVTNTDVGSTSTITLTEELGNLTTIDRSVKRVTVEGDVVIDQAQASSTIIDYATAESVSAIYVQLIPQTVQYVVYSSSLTLAQSANGTTATAAPGTYHISMVVNFPKPFRGTVSLGIGAKQFATVDGDQRMAISGNGTSSASASGTFVNLSISY